MGRREGSFQTAKGFPFPTLFDIFFTTAELGFFTIPRHLLSNSTTASFSVSIFYLTSAISSIIAWVSLLLAVILHAFLTYFSSTRSYLYLSLFSLQYSSVFSLSLCSNSLTYYCSTLFLSTSEDWSIPRLSCSSLTLFSRTRNWSLFMGNLSFKLFSLFTLSLEFMYPYILNPSRLESRAISLIIVLCSIESRIFLPPSSLM